MDEDFEDREWPDDGGDGVDSDAEEAPPQQEPAQVVRECMLLFASPDYIMEPGITGTLQRYFSVRAGHHWHPAALLLGQSRASPAPCSATSR